jgi:hypothetical protein
MAEKIREISPSTSLYRDEATGIAWVRDGRTGFEHSPHPSIDSTGSVEGMKKQGHWRRDDRTVRANGYIFNIDSSWIDGELDQIAADACQCGGKH